MKRTGGFTIIEMLITAAVIVILAAIGFVAYNRMRARAMDAKLEQEAAQLAHHIDAMIAKRGTTQEVLREVIRGDGDNAAIRKYLNLGEFQNVKIKAWETTYGWYEHIQTYTFDGYACIGNKSDDNTCYDMDNIRDKIILHILDDKGSPWGGSSNSKYMSIDYYSHVKGWTETYRKYEFTDD